MKKFTFSLFLVYFIFLTNLLGTDLSMEIQRVAFKQSKKISKIVIKEGACNSLNGHLINTCNLTKKPISQQKYIHNKKTAYFGIYSATAKLHQQGQGL